MGITTVFKSKRDGRTKTAGSDTDMELELYKFFKVVKEIGKGSYSRVYEVQRLSDGRRYALKQTPVQSLNARERKDMVNEIRLLASLEHPNLMKYYEAFVDHHQLCIVADLATGDLAKLIDKRAESGDWLPERQVWSYFIQLALALRYLHHNHVLHRDLKPQNILISPCGLLKLGDLGIAQVLDHVFTRALIGTVYYMSPEMWRNDPYSYSADIWALGCVLYELCALKPLFMAKSHKEINAKVLSGLVDPLPSRYSLELWEVMRACLTQDPAHRPTVDELLAMPAVQARFPLAPQEDLSLLHQATSQSHVQLLRPIEIPRVSADWEHINAFMPPAKYSVGPSVADSLRMKASSSCPELLRAAAQGSSSTAGSSPAGRRADSGAGSGGRGGGGCALFGPSASDAVLCFGGGDRQQPGSACRQGTAAPAGSVLGLGWRVTAPAEEPAAAAAVVRKVPSAGTMRELLRSHTVAVGEVVFNTQKEGGTGRGSQGSVEGGSGSGSGSGGAVVEQPDGRSAGGRLSPSEAQAIAAAVAEAWERKASVAGRHSVTVAQVLQTHTATASTAQQHRREQDRQLLLGSAQRFSPVPVEFCPAPRPKAAAPAGPAAAASAIASSTAQHAGSMAALGASSAAGSAAGRTAEAPAGVAAGGSEAAAAAKQEVKKRERGPRLLRFWKKLSKQ